MGGLISVYKVCSITINPTKTNTALTQYLTMFNDKIEKKRKVSLTITHPEIFIAKLTKLNHEVIIGIDANKAFTSNVGDTARLCKKYQLIDPISTKHIAKGEHSTYSRGSDRIDHFYAYA